jgi:hypothetical protein
MLGISSTVQTQCNGKCSGFDKSGTPINYLAAEKKYCFSLHILRTTKHFPIKIDFHPVSSLF